MEIKFLVLGFFSLAILQVQGQDQSDFISLDCGLPANTSYSDEKTSLYYISDASFIYSGVARSLPPEFSTNSIDRQLWYVRSFPLGLRNCYNVTVTANTKYLIRATFMYGNYDNLNQLPEFDLHIGPNKWVTVQIQNTSTPVIEEIIYDASVSYICICLVNINSETPFISALELRPLRNTTYVTQSGAGALALIGQRLDLGSISNQDHVRYPYDIFDRFWYPFHLIQLTDISTNLTIDVGRHNDYQPPPIVMRSAVIPANSSNPLQVSIGDSVKYKNFQFYMYMHFADVVKLEANQSRKFNISRNGTIWFGPIIPLYLYTRTAYSESAITGGDYLFSLFKVDGSTLPPLLNAIEVYYLVELLQSETNRADIDAIMSIKSTYGISRNWQGDPCAPQVYVWDGLNCSYNGTAPIITSLNLSSSGLTGEIASDIANLKSLKSLDLSNNSLIGPVPDFLSKLVSLEVLNLTDNRLTGRIPVDLLKRRQNGLLLLSVDGNPELCALDSCNANNKKNYVVPVTVPFSALFAIVAAISLAKCRERRKKQAAVAGEMMEAQARILESRKRQFTYSKVLEITNNFERVLGRGGFGTVYHGLLGDTEVAVKTLSPSSVQGYKEFQAEVKLLLRVHHKNLTTLVGYCEEPSHMVLIYEYMANGDLKHHLSGDDPENILSWEGRLRIAIGVAQGLEYLHNGCKPPIVHRDVKTTNILLDSNFQAKLADFGLSRVFPTEDGSHVSTTVAGTPGYLDPEYHVTNWLTEKSDVYSYGVVLLEIITSRPVIAKTGDRTHLSTWVSSMLDKGDIKTISDPRLHGDFDTNSVWKVTELAMACVSEISAERPTMSQVLVELNECLATEMARTREGRSQSNSNSIEFTNVDLSSGLFPQPR